jgi:hypothetical protein
LDISNFEKIVDEKNSTIKLHTEIKVDFKLIDIEKKD